MNYSHVWIIFQGVSLCHEDNGFPDRVTQITLCLWLCITCYHPRKGIVSDGWMRFSGSWNNAFLTFFIVWKCWLKETLKIDIFLISALGSYWNLLINPELNGYIVRWNMEILLINMLFVENYETKTSWKWIRLKLDL